MTDCTHLQILNFTGPIPGVDRRRWWVELGDTLTLTDDIALRVLRQRQHRREDYALRVEMLAGGVCSAAHVLRPGEALDLREWLSVLVLRGRCAWRMGARRRRCWRCCACRTRRSGRPCGRRATRFIEPPGGRRPHGAAGAAGTGRTTR